MNSNHQSTPTSTHNRRDIPVATEPVHRRHARKIFLALLMAAAGAWCYVAPSQAASRAMHFEQLTLTDGLSQNTVMSILQDSQGYLWLGTENGLNRYDGYSFTRFARDSRDPRALRSDFIWSIAEDANGDLWLATEGGGVARWDRRRQEFQNFTHNPAEPGSLASNLVRTLMIGRDGAIWIGHRGAGLDRLDPATGQVTHYRHDASDSFLAATTAARTNGSSVCGKRRVGDRAGMTISKVARQWRPRF